MGSKKLNYILKKKLNNINSINNFNQFIGKKIGIDISLFIFKFLYNKDNILEELIKQIIFFYNLNITPYYVLMDHTQKKKLKPLIIGKIKNIKLIKK